MNLNIDAFHPTLDGDLISGGVSIDIRVSSR